MNGDNCCFEKNLSALRTIYSGTSPLGHLYSRDTKFGCEKNVYIIFVSVTSIEGTPLSRGKDHFS